MAKNSKKENIDFGFIDITQKIRDGQNYDQFHKSSLQWNRGSNEVYVLGNIPHGNKIIITPELIKQLSKVINYNPCNYLDQALNEGSGVYIP